MASYLTKAEALLKLSPFGVKSVSGLRRLIREQGLPARYISPRKVFFEEREIDQWLGMRHEVVANVYATSVKGIEYQREKRKMTIPFSKCRGSVSPGSRVSLAVVYTQSVSGADCTGKVHASQLRCSECQERFVSRSCRGGAIK